MLDFHAHPLEPKKHETKSRLVKPAHGMPNRDFPLKSHASKRSNHTKMALPKFKGTLLLKNLVASCVLISSVGAESTAPPPPAPPSPSPPCGDTDPSFCEAELPTVFDKIAKCSFTSTFVEKCKGTCSLCPAPPPPPPPPSPPPPSPCKDIDPAFCASTDPGPAGGVGILELKIVRCKVQPWSYTCEFSCSKCIVPPPSPSPSPPCGDIDPSFCEAEVTTVFDKIAKCSFTSTFFEKCKGTCGFCPAPPPSPPPPPPPPPPSPSPSPPCGDTDPSFCEAELTTVFDKIAKCSFTSTFFEKCKGTCSFCPAPPPSPPPPSPSCSDKEGETCNKKKCDKYPLRKKRKCRKTCDLCGPLPPASPPAAPPAPETNCSGLADKKKCKITKMVKKCQKKPPKSMRKCQKNCKKDGKKKHAKTIAGMREATYGPLQRNYSHMPRISGTGGPVHVTSNYPAALHLLESWNP